MNTPEDSVHAASWINRAVGPARVWCRCSFVRLKVSVDGHSPIGLDIHLSGGGRSRRKSVHVVSDVLHEASLVALGEFGTTAIGQGVGVSQETLRCPNQWSRRHLIPTYEFLVGAIVVDASPWLSFYRSFEVSALT